MNNLNRLKQEAVKIAIKTDFEDCYSCCRVWSAWSYNTMSQDDFIPVSDDPDVLEEISESIVQKINDNADFESILSVFDDYVFYYNNNIENNFDSMSFHEDYFDYIDVSSLKELLPEKDFSLKDINDYYSSFKSKKENDSFTLGLGSAIDLMKGNMTKKEFIQTAEINVDSNFYDGLESAIFAIEKYDINSIKKVRNRKMKP